MTEISSNDMTTLAKTLWGEARGEGATGMLAVACVIRNRVKNPRWWGRTYAEVCRKDWQFSCWNPGDPNRAKLEQLSATGRDLELARALAFAVTGEDFPDITNGANHYCTKAVAGSTMWAKGQKPVATIGNHLFYRL